MIKYIQADLMASPCVVIAHGCNTRGQFAAGVAGQIRKNFPAVANAYEIAVRSLDFFVGTAQFVPVEIPNRPECMTRYCYNLGSQLNPGDSGKTGLWAVYLSFCNMLEQCKALGIFEVGIPRIGTDIANKRWEDVQDKIAHALIDTGTAATHNIWVHDHVPQLGVGYSIHPNQEKEQPE